MQPSESSNTDSNIVWTSDWVSHDKFTKEMMKDHLAHNAGYATLVAADKVKLKKLHKCLGL